MTAPVISPYRSLTPDRRDGFAQLLHAEWTKFRTVRGWVIAMVIAVLLPGLLGLLNHDSCSNGNNTACTIPIGPGGEAVTDSFYFLHQPLAGNGSITVRITSLTGQIMNAPSSGHVAAGPGGGPATPNLHPGLEPWSKAGIIIKANTTEGSPYAAMMVTGAHGVRMQYDYTKDAAGLPGAVSAATPRWLRLTRTGDRITGYDSADGAHWTAGRYRHAARAAVNRPGRAVRRLPRERAGDLGVAGRNERIRRSHPGHRRLRPHRPAGPLARQRVARRGRRRGRRVPAAAGRLSPDPRRLYRDRVR